MIDRWWLHRLAYPTYDCVDCIGVCYDAGACYCAYYNAYGPCDPDGRWWNRAARWLCKRLRARERDE